MKNLVLVQNLYKDYQTAAGTVPVLKQVDFSMDAGDFVAIMGPSGSGKSTFMNILGCLDKPSSGQYALDGKQVAELEGDALARVRNQTIGFVFQGFNLLSRASLVITLPCRWFIPHRAEERHARAGVLLEKWDWVNISMPCLTRFPADSSNVAIARALVNRPRLILADEPAIWTVRPVRKSWHCFPN